MWRRSRAFAAGALLYGSLAAFIGVVYGMALAGAVVWLGRQSVLVSLFATGLVAVCFQPVRERLRRRVNRLVYGQRVSPEEALAVFSARAARTQAVEDVLPRMADVVAAATGAAAEVWLTVGSELVRAASSDAAAGPAPAPVDPDDAPIVPGADRSIAIRHQGELLGVLAITENRNRPVLPEEEKLLGDLASQAGLVLRNVRLMAELGRRLDRISEQASALRASRQRVVSAQDAERRRLERDIHDGAQQHLVALAVKIRLARRLAEHSPGRARELLGEISELTEGAVATLRQLTKGIYPEVLTARGLGHALEAHAGMTSGSVSIVDEGIGRYVPDVEAAAYFSCHEAIQNAAKHAKAQEIVVRLSERAGELVFEVRDDGVGFDLSEAQRGTGLQNIRDRVSALGGHVDVESMPGRGSTLTGRVPVLLPDWITA